jgi:hypothetical protein
VWVVASVAGVLILTCVAFLIKVPEPELILAPGPAPAVGIVDSVTLHGTMLRDPTPLFLPTAFNSSRKDYVPREPGGAFGGFPAQWVFDKEELDLRLPAPVAVPKSAADALVGEPPGAPFIGFGRANLVVQPLDGRGAYISIVEAGTGRAVFGSPVVDAHPPASTLPWQPMEFLAAVDTSGLVGPVVPTVRSGVDDVDAYFARYLARTLHLGERLTPGFYRISVGP